MTSSPKGARTSRFRCRVVSRPATVPGLGPFSKDSGSPYCDTPSAPCISIAKAMCRWYSPLWRVRNSCVSGMLIHTGLCGPKRSPGTMMDECTQPVELSA
ncbi:MAG: hypothetical protein BWZ02_02800 [Lentisphaerae bacterium ADurb.BinA184]|nr:MAG: hypothetical protein BWZ02_02800 [Lentisphaerae bacterium ADurb.BinA184]